MSSTSVDPTAANEAVTSVPVVPVLEFANHYLAGRVRNLGRWTQRRRQDHLPRLAAGILLPQRGSGRIGDPTSEARGGRYQRQIDFRSAGNRTCSRVCA